MCGRTLLRGERAEIYLAGGTRHSVCELCTARALHGGWVREGTVPEYDRDGDRLERRRSLLGRRRRPRRADGGEVDRLPDAFADDDGPGTPAFADPPGMTEGRTFGLAPAPIDPDGELEHDGDRGPTPEWPEVPSRRPRRGRRRRPAPPSSRQDAPEADRGREPTVGREPRHVHAVPTSIEHRIDAAIELFNDSEHPRTVAGIGRSLGLPDVSVHPTSSAGAIVSLVVCWELCWYRYEVDLSEGIPVVRGAGQGYELSELSELERSSNAVADEQGRLSPA